jgi:MYXO-CTERM domain-containing protein
MVSSGSAPGATCATAGDCKTRYCRESVCCADKCDGVCSKCAATTGACEKVVSADDPDTCGGDKTCDATGACKKKIGSVCESAGECASGFCIDSFCCNKACDGACESCSETRGTCTALARGNLGVPSCSPNRCDGVSGACPIECVADDECAEGFACDRPTKKCISGAVCSDISTIHEPNGASRTCAPYACRGGKCGESCTSVADCAFPAACDESGRCVTANDASSGSCSATPGGASTSSRALPLLFLFAVFARRRRRHA